MATLNETDLPPVFNPLYRQSWHGYLVGMFAGTLIASLAKLINIPHQIPTALFGIIIGVVARLIGNFNDVKLEPHIIHSIYIPLLMAKIVYNMDHYLFMKSLSQICVIGILGNSAFVYFFGMILSLFEKRPIPRLQFMVIAVIIAPNDNPELPISEGIKNLETLMFGESMLTISLGNTARITMLGIIKQYITEWYHIVNNVIRYVGTCIPIGLTCGWSLSFLFRELYNDSMNAFAVYISSAYFVYILCEHVFWCCGAMASFITLYILTKHRPKFLSKTDHDVKLCCNVAYTLVQIFLTIYYIAESVYTFRGDNLLVGLLEAFAIFTMGNVIRLITFLLLSPILSRLGYGFEFASLVTLFWAVQKGPVQMIQVFKLAGDPSSFQLLDSLNLYVVTYLIMSCILNGTTLKILLKAFGLTKLSARKKANISIAITSLNDIGSKLLSTLKGNRYYSDVNWSVINAHTTLKNPFEDFVNVWAKDNVICNVCSSAVPLKPTRDEYNELLKDVTIRTLKAQRVSFLEQHELGLLSKEDVEILLRAVDVAMDSTNMTINITSLLGIINDKTFYTVGKRTRKILTINSNVKIPKSKVRRRLYFITNTMAFELSITFIVVVDLLVLLLQFTKYSAWSRIVLLTLAFMCTACYIIEAKLRLLSYSSGSFWKDLGHYFKSLWNKIDVIIIILSIIYLCVENQNEYGFLRYIDYFKFATSLKLLRILTKLYPHLISKLERRNELKIMRAFGVAQGLVISYDDVMNQLPSFTEQSNIRNVIKSNLDQMRATVTQKMGILEKARPALATTIKTKQVLRCILKHLNEGVRELRSSGLIDAFEFQQLHQSVTLKNKFLANVRILEVLQPNSIFQEIPWLFGNNEALEYIYKHVHNKIYNAGDIICRPGDSLEGVYIIVAGYFKVTYYPTPEVISKLKNSGELPTKEFLEYLRFDEVHEEFLSCGNRIGELSILTNRPYNCSITSEAPSQVFIIPRETLQHAKELCPDPALGLVARIWKSVLFGLGRRLLLTTTAYQSSPIREVEYALIRAVVPDTDYYRVISLTQVVDVLLLEGIAFDSNTREVYIAPCIIPKHVKKLQLHLEEKYKQISRPKLMFIPDSNTDEYEMMLKIQDNSELMPNYNGTMLNEHMDTKKRYASHIFSFNKPRSGTSHTGQKSSFGSGLIFYSTEE